MKIQVRKKVFETNSSSTHCLCICTEEEFNGLENGTKFYCTFNSKIYDSIEDGLKEVPYSSKEFFKTGEELKIFLDDLPYEDFQEERVLPSGEKVIVFGYYGADY